jgi:hypothetical protein
MRKLLQSSPTSGDAKFLITDEIGVEMLFGERSLTIHGRERDIHDELSQARMTADVAFSFLMKTFRRYLAEDVAQIQIRLGKFFDFQAANVAEITLFAACHESSLSSL